VICARVALGAAYLIWASTASTTTIQRAADAATIAPEAIGATLSGDNLVVSLEAGERLAIADQMLAAEVSSRALVTLSSEFLSIAVTAGRMRFESGPSAGAGRVLLLALDGNRPQSLAFDAARLAATLSPGARPLIGADLDRLARVQRKARFWGSYTPLRVNARAQSDAATETVRTAYLSDPAILAQRRVALPARPRHAITAFLDAFRAGDAVKVAALLDPAPFLDRSGMDGIGAGRLRAATTILGDERLRTALLAAGEPAWADDGSATLDGPAGRWRIMLAARDRAFFVTRVEPVT